MRQHPAGDCDCGGNQLDVLGVCGGDCVADADGDGVCDVDDDCVGNTTPAASATDLDRSTSAGAPTSPPAIAIATGTSSTSLACAEGLRGGRDGDGVCDVDDDCVGQYDACGICNGPDRSTSAGAPTSPPATAIATGTSSTCSASAEATAWPMRMAMACATSTTIVSGSTTRAASATAWTGLRVRCANIPAGDCDCGGNQLDVLGVCGGDCVADADGDGVCDVDDDCVGQYDACGICNGPGQVYECGCANIPAGDCDCDGNQLDALACVVATAWRTPMAMASVTSNDDCVGQYDACGICNGPGQVYECGCANIPAGDCDCDGNQLDVLGVCGGDCAADADGDGICDVDDECVGHYDACGICNGPGQIYECGCANIPAGDCDCDGNQADAVGECGGTCTSDVNENGLCDADEDCTYPMAINYNSEASFDNGSCEFAMISDCPADIDGSGHVDVADLLVFLPQFDGYCQ